MYLRNWLEWNCMENLKILFLNNNLLIYIGNHILEINFVLLKSRIINYLIKIAKRINAENCYL